MKAFKEVQIKEFAKAYAKDKSSNAVFQEAHERDFIAGFEKAVSLLFSEEKHPIKMESLSGYIFPSCEDIKRWFQLLVGFGEDAMYEDMRKSNLFLSNTVSVSQQREQLISFFNWYQDDPKELSNNETIVDAYIEEINCG